MSKENILQSNTYSVPTMRTIWNYIRRLSWHVWYNFRLRSNSKSLNYFYKSKMHALVLSSNCIRPKNSYLLSNHTKVKKCKHVKKKSYPFWTKCVHLTLTEIENVVS